MPNSQNILPNRKRGKQVEEKKIPGSINLPFPWKNWDYFSPWLSYSRHMWFGFAQHPSSPSSGIITGTFPHLHSSPTLRPCDSEGEGPPMILPLQSIGVDLRHHYRQPACLSHWPQLLVLEQAWDPNGSHEIQEYGWNYWERKVELIGYT